MLHSRPRAAARIACAAAIFASLALAAGCKGKGHAKVKDVLIPQADAVIDAPDAGALMVFKEVPEVDPPVPSDKVVRLAVHRDVPWGYTNNQIERLLGAGKEVVVLAGRRHKVYAINMSETLEDDYPIEILVLKDGMACARAPGVRESKCAHSPDKKHVDRAGVRQITREAVKVLKKQDVLVTATPSLSFADVVRAVDGARTCCKDKTIRVKLETGEVVLE